MVGGRVLPEALDLLFTDEPYIDFLADFPWRAPDGALSDLTSAVDALVADPRSARLTVQRHRMLRTPAPAVVAELCAVVDFLCGSGSVRGGPLRGLEYRLTERFLSVAGSATVADRPWLVGAGSWRPPGGALFAAAGADPELRADALGLTRDLLGALEGLEPLEPRRRALLGLYEQVDDEEDLRRATLEPDEAGGSSAGDAGVSSAGGAGALSRLAERWAVRATDDVVTQLPELTGPVGYLSWLVDGWCAVHERLSDAVPGVSSTVTMLGELLLSAGVAEPPPELAVGLRGELYPDLYERMPTIASEWSEDGWEQQVRGWLARALVAGDVLPARAWLDLSVRVTVAVQGLPGVPRGLGRTALPLAQFHHDMRQMFRVRTVRHPLSVAPGFSVPVSRPPQQGTAGDERADALVEARSGAHAGGQGDASEGRPSAVRPLNGVYPGFVHVDDLAEEAGDDADSDVGAGSVETSPRGPAVAPAADSPELFADSPEPLAEPLAGPLAESSEASESAAGSPSERGALGPTALVGDSADTEAIPRATEVAEASEVSGAAAGTEHAESVELTELSGAGVPEAAVEVQQPDLQQPELQQPELQQPELQQPELQQSELQEEGSQEAEYAAGGEAAGEHAAQSAVQPAYGVAYSEPAQAVPPEEAPPEEAPPEEAGPPEEFMPPETAQRPETSHRAPRDAREPGGFGYRPVHDDDAFGLDDSVDTIPAPAGPPPAGPAMTGPPPASHPAEPEAPLGEPSVGHPVTGSASPEHAATGPPGPEAPAPEQAAPIPPGHRQHRAEQVPPAQAPGMPQDQPPGHGDLPPEPLEPGDLPPPEPPTYPAAPPDQAPHEPPHQAPPDQTHGQPESPYAPPREQTAEAPQSPDAEPSEGTGFQRVPVSDETSPDALAAAYLVIDAIVGQPALTAALREAAGTPEHAIRLLVAGPPGTGRGITIDALTKILAVRGFTGAPVRLNVEEFERVRNPEAAVAHLRERLAACQGERLVAIDGLDRLVSNEHNGRALAAELQQLITTIGARLQIVGFAEGDGYRRIVDANAGLAAWWRVVRTRDFDAGDFAMIFARVVERRGASVTEQAAVSAGELLAATRVDGELQNARLATYLADLAISAASRRSGQAARPTVDVPDLPPLRPSPGARSQPPAGEASNGESTPGQPPAASPPGGPSKPQ